MLESQHMILDGYFSRLFADRRPKIKEKDAGNSPISKVAGTDLQSVALPHN